MNSADLLQSVQLPLFKLLDSAAVLKHAASRLSARAYQDQLSELSSVADAQELRGLKHVSRLFESGLEKRLREPRELEDRERVVLGMWPELVLTEVIGGNKTDGAWSILHTLCAQPWMPHVPEHFVARIESLLAEDAQRFGDEMQADDAIAAASYGDQMAPAVLEDEPVENGFAAHTAPPPLPLEVPAMIADDAFALAIGEVEGEHIATHAAAPAPVSTAGVAPLHAGDWSDAGHVDDEVEDGHGIGGSAAEPGSDGKVTAEELAMLRDALSGMREEFAPAFAAHQPSDPLAALLEQYTEQLENILNATAHLGLAGLQRVMGVVQINVMSLQLSDDDAPVSVPYTALIGWLDRAMAYLDAPSDHAIAQSLAGMTVDTAWLLPAGEDTVPECVLELTSIEVIRARAASDRPTEALREHVDLRVPADVDRNVLNSLLHELPLHAQEFSALVQRLDSKGSLDELEHARRVAHTLKGAGNTVGVKGVGNLTHILEDILVACGRAERMPTPELQETLIEAADCLEAMSESLVSETPAPAESLAVYQKVLDWANLIDRDGLPADGEVAPLLRAPARATAPIEHATGEVIQSVEADVQQAPSADENETYLRVPATLIDSLLKLVGENSIITSQVQDRVARLTDDLNAQRTGSRQIRQLSSDLEQLVDVRGLAMMGGSTGDLDALEMDQYNELHMLSRRIVESAADSREFSQAFEREVASLRDLMAAKERIQVEIQRSIQRTRMVEVSSVTPRLQRTVRQAARVLGKEVRLIIRGESTLVDTQLLNRTLDPLMHMLRNAVDHGIEHAEARVAAGKSAAGTITLSFQTVGASISVRCEDDGGGLDLAMIHGKAVNANLVDANEKLTDAQIMRLIMLPGFSTREQASLVSGRGIGMDVVQRAVTELRGTIDTQSTLGKGTSFAMSFPVQMSATQVMISQSSQHLLAISERGVEQLLPVGSDLHAEADGSLTYMVQGERIPALRLESLLALPSNAFQQIGTTEAVMIVFDETRQRRAVIVPELSESKNVVVKPFNTIVPRTMGVDGATILGDGSVASVIDLPDMLRDYDASSKFGGHHLASTASARLPLCLIVDDSVSVRRTMEQLMQDTGYDVISARDGIDALGTLQRRTPDIVLVDLEMPRMNGLELTNALRNRAETKATPVVMITSRFTDKHKKLAEEAGVDAFLTKPYSEEQLLGTMERLLNAAA
jgi:chemotaxis protein histidine kinase CheA/ActR/RegA family two-component response regulator